MLTALSTLTQHLKATHDPTALLEYEAAKRRAAREAAMLAYLEVVGSTPHHPRCEGREAIDACWRERRYLVERAREAYRRACE